MSETANQIITGLLEQRMALVETIAKTKSIYTTMTSQSEISRIDTLLKDLAARPSPDTKEGA